MKKGYEAILNQRKAFLMGLLIKEEPGQTNIQLFKITKIYSS